MPVIIPLLEAVILPFPDTALIADPVCRDRVQDPLPDRHTALQLRISFRQGAHSCEEFFQDRKIDGGIDGRRHRMGHLDMFRRHEIARRVFRRNTGVEMDAAVRVEGDKVLIERSDLHQKRQDAVFEIFFIPGIAGVPCIMLGDPPGSSYPVHDDRHHLIGRRYAGRRARRHIETVHAEQLAGVILKSRDPVIIVPEKGFMEGQQVSGKDMPIDHLCVFIGHVMRPHQTVFSGPQPIQRERISLRIRAADKQIPPVPPHLFDQLNGLSTAVCLQKQFFIAVPCLRAGLV